MTSQEKVVFVSDLFKTPHIRRRWMSVAPMLGLVPDKQIARRLGVSTGRVCAVRRQMRVAPMTFESHCEHYGTAAPIRPHIC